MLAIASQQGRLGKLLTLSQSIAGNPLLLEEMISEINSNEIGAICSMFKAFFKKPLLDSLGIYTDILQIFFRANTISEIPLFHSADLRVHCFFMPKGTFFPLHDHPNQVICTGVLFGEVKYLSLNKKAGKWHTISKKGTAKASKVLFCTLKNSNIHSILAAEDSIILDIFMPNDTEDGNFECFQVQKKRKRSFLLEEKSMCSF